MKLSVWSVHRWERNQTAFNHYPLYLPIATYGHVEGKKIAHYQSPIKAVCILFLSNSPSLKAQNEIEQVNEVTEVSFSFPYNCRPFICQFLWGFYGNSGMQINSSHD